MSVSEFLSEHEPFTQLDASRLTELAEAVQTESFAPDELIFDQGAEPAERVRIIVSGSVELSDRGRTLDLLGPGELFGHPSMLAGLPTSLAARAHEQTVCYRLPFDILIGLLGGREGLRFVARSLLARRSRTATWDGAASADPARRSVAAFIREPVVTCNPSATVRDVAKDMAALGASCALVHLRDDGLGIVTDNDLRVRVIAGGMPLDAAVERAMTAPAFTVGSARLGIDVMVEMIDRGIRHVPVISARGEVLGVVTDVDLLASETRTPIMLRRRIARASDLDGLAVAAAQLRPALVALHDGQVASTHLCAIITAFADALTRRALELLIAEDDDLPPLAWLATGSLGRREAFASSDVDSALVWEGEADSDRLQGLAVQVLDVLERCGFARDPHAASAAHPLFSQSADDWRQAIARWLDRPHDPRLLIVLSILEDAREVYRHGQVSDALAGVREIREHPAFLGRMRRLALSHRPPTGFLRDIVVEHSGEHRGQFDVKRGGLLPVVGLACYFGLATNTRSTSTLERLRAAADLGALGRSEADALEEAFELFVDLRMEHQIEQLRHGEQPTDFIDPATLNPLMRRYVREAFRTIARAQRELTSQAPT